MVTVPATHKQTGPITILHCGAVSVRCNYVHHWRDVRVSQYNSISTRDSVLIDREDNSIAASEAKARQNDQLSIACQVNNDTGQP